MDAPLLTGSDPTRDAAAAGGEFHVRPARPGDAAAAAPLIYLPMGALADYLFGLGAPARAREVFERLFAQDENRFSYQFAEVIEGRRGVAGLLLGYPGRALKDTEIPMAQQLRAIYGWGGMLRFLRRSLPLMRYRECAPDDFYIFTLAIDPAFQHHCLGARLLEHADAKARTHGLPQCSLGVTVDNEGAIRFYQRHEFRIVETVAIPHLARAIGYPGYHRMIKVLAPANRHLVRPACPSL